MKRATNIKMIINIGLLGQISALLVFFTCMNTFADAKGFDQYGNRIEDDKCELF